MYHRWALTLSVRALYHCADRRASQFPGGILSRLQIKIIFNQSQILLHSGHDTNETCQKANTLLYDKTCNYSGEPIMPVVKLGHPLCQRFCRLNDALWFSGHLSLCLFADLQNFLSFSARRVLLDLDQAHLSQSSPFSEVYFTLGL